ncbi:hypothetical protein LTS18_010328 [Coniosporium uncinatum]|uniref:Uncharacterized protein n=1 Tax=Coniosporium uncinatum TaxID=93489 RepID=A0ACC3DLC7_9PEZI|nr:hypothetical protein LTS18_010328 [Coniosporium uncinatum]
MPPRSLKELRKLNEWDLAFKEESSTNPFPSNPDADFFTSRALRATHLSSLRHLYPIPGPIPSEVTESYRNVPVRDGSTIRVKIYQPAGSPPGASPGGPLIVMYHEGGWSMGDLTDEDLNCRMLARDLGAVCVNVEYRLAPEFPFPTGVHDCWDALRWCAAHAVDELGADAVGKGFVVGGGSAGGNLAAVMTHLARDEGLEPALTGQYLCVPALLPEGRVPEEYRAEYLSRRESVDDPVLKDAVRKSGIHDILKPDEGSELFVPFNHPKGHAGLPPAYLQVCGMDPLRDEALIYERVLREECGVKTRLDVYPGHGHYFWTNWPKLEMSRKFVDDTLEGVRWLLDQSPKGTVD